MTADCSAALVREVEAMFLGADDAARVLGVGKTMIFGLAAAGELRRVKAGRRTLFPVADVRALGERMLAGERVNFGYGCSRAEGAGP
jgi:excisionase family DNA binding protein